MQLYQLLLFGGSVKASLAVPSFGNNFDVERGLITNVEVQQQLQDAVNSLLPNAA